VLQFIDETLAGETLRDHEVRLQVAETVRARELLQLRFGDNAEIACEAFSRGAFRLQVAGAQIDSLDAQVHLVPGLAVKLIRLAPLADRASYELDRCFAVL
jgi:transcriptional regulator of met regulon